MTEMYCLSGPVAAGDDGDVLLERAGGGGDHETG